MINRSFFSPFNQHLSIRENDLVQVDIVSGVLTLFELHKKRWFLLTIKDKTAKIVTPWLHKGGKFRFNFGTLYGRSSLVIEETENGSQGLIIESKHSVAIRANDATFFPKDNHARKETVVHIFKDKNTDKTFMALIPPKDYRIKRLDKIELHSEPQPDVDWNSASRYFNEQKTTRYGSKT